MHRRGRYDSPWAGRPKPGRKRVGFSSTPRTCWCTISAQERGNPCTVATSASTGTAQRVATHSHGVPARTCVEFGQEDLPRLSSWFTVWCGFGPRRVHTRDAPCLPRRPRNIVSGVRSCTRFRQRTGSHCCVPQFDVGHHDSAAQE